MIVYTGPVIGPSILIALAALLLVEWWQLRRRAR